MSKSAIYTANTSEQNVPSDGTINLGTIIRRYGPNVNLSGNAIQISGVGYYDIDANFTVAPTEAASEITISLLKNGVLVPGASATFYVETENTPVTIPISSLVREFCCCEEISSLTFTVSGAPAIVSNVAVVVEKL